MIDDARPALADGGQHVAEIADVAADEIEAVGVGGEPTLGAGAAVKDGEALFFFEQRRHERPPDETGAAGDEDTAWLRHAAMVAAGARKGNRRLGLIIQPGEHFGATGIRWSVWRIIGMQKQGNSVTFMLLPP